MRILRINLFIICVIWQDQLGIFATIYSEAFTWPHRDIMIRQLTCKNLENGTPLLRLKKYLFCEYDSDVRSNQHNKVTNVTMRMIPNLMDFRESNSLLTLHNWLILSWKDAHLTWTPREYSDISYIHVQSYEIWVPDLNIYNSADMSQDTEFTRECLLKYDGTVKCVPPMKYTTQCNSDYTNWPFDKHTCTFSFGSWIYPGEEIDFHLDDEGITMNIYEQNSMWDLKFIKAVKVVEVYISNYTFPKIDYEFLLTRHHGLQHAAYITPAVALMLLTITALWLDSRSVERMAVASVNFICHLFCMFQLHWQLPYNGINPPNIMLFYRESLAMAAFSLILTLLLRKLQDMNTEMPKWISSTTTFVLSYKAGRLLLLNDEESKMTNEVEENTEVAKSGIKTKESSWKYFAAIVEWLSFFCVIFAYIIILIILLPKA